MLMHLGRSVVNSKPTNPKDAIGSDKLPLHLWPESATAMGCIGMLDGALKYGRGNFRAIGVRASIYVDACRRHLAAWMEGEDCATDSLVPHLAHALACLAIIVDAEAAGKLNDDRNLSAGYRELVEKLTPHVPRLKAAHSDKNPYHYTIAYAKKTKAFRRRGRSGTVEAKDSDSTIQGDGIKKSKRNGKRH